ncbi:MAG: iron-containing alcohol dehydrogenase [Armatimonadetes bacterium]|nr:iron-containing alcohol dehydrogenase [Armatimonadota bacterium]
MERFSFYNPVRLYFGEGEFGRLGEAVAALGRRALIVTGRRAMREAGWLDQAVELLKAARVDPVVFDRVTANPSDGIVEEGAALAREARCDVVVGLGGGSSMDTAKAVAVRATHDEPIAHFVSAGPWGEKRVPGPQTLPVVCATSTAGTSSELTRFAVVTVEATKKKAAVVGNAIYPRVAIDDPRLTYSAPRSVTAETGIDVLCHAVEAFLSRVAQPVTDACAQRAMALVAEWLPRAVVNGQDPEARRQMLLANVFAGYPLSQIGGTLVHALEHPISALHPEIPHGRGLAVLLPEYLEAMAEVLPEKTAVVAQVLTGEADATAADAAPAVRHLLQRVGLSVRLSDIGVSEQELTAVVEGALDYMAVAIERTPGDWDAGALKRLLQNTV